jgi:predicted RNA-binding protein associated with RNAse of E/G family
VAGDRDVTPEEIKLNEIDALTVALAQERVAHAQLALAMRQRELESVIATIRTRYEDAANEIVAIDTVRGTVARRGRTER